MKRAKLKERNLPSYSLGEERMNMVTHIAGGGVGIFALVACLYRSVSTGSTPALVTSLVYCLSMITVYTISSIYHGLRPGTAKRVMQVLDHCAIYLLITGTYTPITIVALAPQHPVIGWGLTAFQWTMATLAITLTAIDLKKYKAFSMVCYICCGWAVLPFLPQLWKILTPTGFYLLLWGGISYTVGAILFGIGSKLKWFHSIFHILVVLGSILQLLCILFYVY